jgi:tripartite-type tricarboxylate transporter receptor subunit TctC
MAIEAHIKLLHVPYRGGPAAAEAAAAGDVPLGVVTPSSVKALIEAGKVKVIALTGFPRADLRRGSALQRSHSPDRH